MIRIGKTAAVREGYFEFDTASTHHTTNNLNLLTDIQNNLSMKITRHDHSMSIYDTMGTLLIKHNEVNMKLEKCLYKPTYSNIISGFRMTQNYDQKTRGSESTITSGGKILYKIERQADGLWIKTEAYDGKARINWVKEKELAISLHERYGYISYDTLRTLPEFPKDWKEKIRYEACEKEKATKLPSPKQPLQNRATKLLERIHVDLIGPMDTPTPVKQNKYLMMIVDDHSRYMLTHAIPTKGDAGDALIIIINKLEKAVSSVHERPIQLSQIQADWGGEFRNSKLITELNQGGITLKETVPKHSETNAIVKRANRTILEMSRTGLIAAGLPKGLWDKASNSAAYTKNPLPHKALGGKTPIEIILAKDPVNERKNLRPFGQKVTCYNYEVKDKLSARSYKERIIRYTTTFGIYGVRTANGAIKLAKNPTPVIPDNESEESSSEEEILPPEISDWDQPDPPPEDLGLAAAPKKKRWTAEEWTNLVGTRKSTRDRKPKIFAVGADPDHPTDQQAKTSPQAKEWAEARIKEREQLLRYQVFTKIRKSDIPEGTRIVDTKWVYLVKRKADGTIEKYKARKVGRGFT